MFQFIKSLFGYGDLVDHGNLCDVFFCHNKLINKWVLDLQWEHQHIYYELMEVKGVVKVIYCKDILTIECGRLKIASKMSLDPETVHNLAINSSVNNQKLIDKLVIFQAFLKEMCNKLGINLTYDINNCVEFLSEFFKADVYFCHRPVPYINVDDISKRHWALYFTWKHKQVRYELGKVEGSGNIKADCTKGDLPDAFTKVRICSDKWLYPYKVHRAAMNCSLNNQLYDPGWRNCQIWIKEVAKALDIHIDYEIISGISAFVGHLLPVSKKNAKPV
ncbi:unnamed protein product [Meganyctiphanes norvegica]|uniref:Uncharacterized protein n=1 Tax=Meganyctiphanes norvegica TaxID=48144 RepID=A0AAV2Q5S4_MEGNR